MIVVFGIVTTRRPNSGKVIGKRLVLCTPNRAQYDFTTGEMVQSFQGRFRMVESGDYSQITPEIVEKFIASAQEMYNITRIIL